MMSINVFAYMPKTSKRAAGLRPGDPLVLLGDSEQHIKDGFVFSNRISLQHLIRLRTESGIFLTCSDDTLVPLHNGTLCSVNDVLHQPVPVLDNFWFRWEEVDSINDDGIGEVTTMYCLDQCYAAGDEPDRFIFTHNV